MNNIIVHVHSILFCITDADNSTALCQWRNPHRHRWSAYIYYMYHYIYRSPWEHWRGLQIELEWVKIITNCLIDIADMVKNRTFVRNWIMSGYIIFKFSQQKFPWFGHQIYMLLFILMEMTWFVANWLVNRNSGIINCKITTVHTTLSPI